MPINKNEVSNLTIFKYENIQQILSQYIFHGRKYYYDLINISNNNLTISYLCYNICCIGFYL